MYSCKTKVRDRGIGLGLSSTPGSVSNDTAGEAAYATIVALYK